jgi:hypothetical protein
MKTKLLLVACLFFCLKNNAQPPSNASGYTFTASSSTYTYLTGGTSMSSWVGDDNVATVPIGFSFNFCGTTYTNVNVGTNGFVSFTNASAYNYTTSDMSGFVPGLMPFLNDGDGTVSGSGSYLTYGTAPNRVFTFEWRNWGTWFPSGSIYNILSFQVKLYENGFIEFLYKREGGSTTGETPAIGIAKTASNYILLSNTSSSPTPSSSTAYTASGVPATGQSYLFSFCTTPSIAAHPQSVVKCIGDDISFSVNATNVTNYQWQENSGNGFVDLSNGGDYSGVNTATLNITSTPNSYNNRSYRAMLTGTCPTGIASLAANITLANAIDIVNVSPSDTACEGNPTTLSVTAAGVGLIYQWQMQDKANNYFDINNMPPYSGANTDVFNISAVPDSIDGRNFRVLIKATTSCPVNVPVYSSAAQLTVNKAPIVSPAIANVYEGESASFTTSTNNISGLSYQWQEDKNNGAGFSNLSDNTTYTGSTTPTLAINNVTTSQQGNIYRCIVSGMCDAGYIISKDAVLNVNTKTGIAHTGKQLFSIYPNPVTKNNDIFIQTSGNIKGTTSVKLTDEMGRTVYSANVDLSTVNKIPINPGDLTAGIYNLQLANITDNIIEVFPVVVE